MLAMKDAEQVIGGQTPLILLWVIEVSRLALAPDLSKKSVSFSKLKNTIFLKVKTLS